MKLLKKCTCMLIFILVFSLLSGCGTGAADLMGSAQTNFETAVIETSPQVSESTSQALPNISSTGLTVRFLDVGQGDSALIECDGHYMLIDGGGREKSSLIYSVLQADKIDHLDIIIGSHADEDHIGGLSGALNYATAEITLCPVTEYSSKTFENFKKYAELSGGGIQVPKVGDVYDLGNARIEILAVNSGSSSNDSSIVAKLTYGNISFLFTGDAETETEEFLFDSGTDLTTTVLKVSHHGSKDSSSAEFLQRSAPEYVVISVGADNSYGHPTEEALARINATGAEVLRTDLIGDITFYTDGSSISVMTEKSSGRNKQAETSSSYSASTSETTGTSESGSTDPSASQSSDGNVTYILNTSSRKFHDPSCDSVSKMSDKNKQEYIGSREDLLSMEYSPCGACKP